MTMCVVEGTASPSIAPVDARSAFDEVLAYGQMALGCGDVQGGFYIYIYIYIFVFTKNGRVVGKGCIKNDAAVKEDGLASRIIYTHERTHSCDRNLEN